MAVWNPIENIRNGIKLVKESIDLGKQIQSSITVDYKELSGSLFEIFKEVFTGVDNLKNEIEKFALIDPSNTNDLNDWAKGFQGIESRKNDLKISCNKIKKIIDANFDNRLKKFFSKDGQKFNDAKNTLRMLSESDTNMVNMVDYIIDDQLVPIKETIIFAKTESIQTKHSESIGELKQEYDKLKNYSLELNSIKTKFDQISN